MVVTSWTAAPLAWPRCRAIHQRGGSGLLITEELIRAVRTESSSALQYWFGVSPRVIWCWRKAFDVSQWGTEGSKRLHQVVCETAAKETRGKAQPVTQIRRRLATRRKLGVRKPTGRVDGWKQEEMHLLGKIPDAEAAAILDRTENAVRIRRIRLGIPTAKDRRRH